jgi:hypothetical protein
MVGLELQKRLEGEFGQRLIEGRTETGCTLLKGIRRANMRRFVAALAKG